MFYMFYNVMFYIDRTPTARYETNSIVKFNMRLRTCVYVMQRQESEIDVLGFSF